jgi:DNA-binding cell septation regulator SpoVG
MSCDGETGLVVHMPSSKLAQKFNMDIFHDSWTSLYPAQQLILRD